MILKPFLPLKYNYLQSDPESIPTTEIQQSTITDFTSESTTISLTESSFLPSTTIAFLSTFSTESTVSSMITGDPGSNFSTPSQEETTQEGTSTSPQLLLPQHWK